MDRDFTISLTCGMMGTDLDLFDGEFEDLTLREMEDIQMKMNIILRNLNDKIKWYYNG